MYTRKGKPWYFGTKANIGVASQSRFIHSVRVTSARVHDSRLVSDVLQGDERRVYGDSAYTGQKHVTKYYQKTHKLFLPSLP